MLREHKMEHCLKLFHFHVGSQLTAQLRQVLDFQKRHSNRRTASADLRDHSRSAPRHIVSGGKGLRNNAIEAATVSTKA